MSWDSCLRIHTWYADWCKWGMPCDSVIDVVHSWTAMRFKIGYSKPVRFSSIRRCLPKTLLRPSHGRAPLRTSYRQGSLSSSGDNISQNQRRQRNAILNHGQWTPFSTPSSIFQRRPRAKICSGGWQRLTNLIVSVHMVPRQRPISPLNLVKATS